MKKTVSALFAGAMLLGTAVTGANAANMGEKMMMMMQCSSACNAQYTQCLMNANQLAATPMEGMSQLMTNFQGSTACGQEAMMCQQSCS